MSGGQFFIGAFVLWCVSDYVLGVLATMAARYATGFDVRIEWVSLGIGFSEATLTVGPITWANPKKFHETPYLARLGRVAVRLRPASVLRHLRGGGGGGAPPVEVLNVEVEDVAVNVERGSKGLNVWAALGVSDAEGEQRAADLKEETGGAFDPAAFDDDGEEEPAPGAPGGGAAAVGVPPPPDAARVVLDRFCLRGARFDVDAFLKASKTSGATRNAVDVRCLEVLGRELGPKRRAARRDPRERAGVPLDDVVNTIVWRVVDRVAAENAGALVRVAAGAAADRATAAVKNATNATARNVGRAARNAGHSGTAVKVHGRLAGVASSGALRVTVVGAKHARAPPPSGIGSIFAPDRKPACYVKIQIGKKGVKAKTTVAAASANPSWDEAAVDLAPLESLDGDLRVQLYDRHVLHADVQIGGTLKIPLRTILAGGPVIGEWFVLPPPRKGDAPSVLGLVSMASGQSHRAPVIAGDKATAVKLSLALVGVDEPRADAPDEAP